VALHPRPPAMVNAACTRDEASCRFLHCLYRPRQLPAMPATCAGIEHGVQRIAGVCVPGA
jgi:hypothetical protein